MLLSHHTSLPNADSLILSLSIKGTTSAAGGGRGNPVEAGKEDVFPRSCKAPAP